jgi:hypothetical protein
MIFSLNFRKITLLTIIAFTTVLLVKLSDAEADNNLNIVIKDVQSRLSSEENISSEIDEGRMDLCKAYDVYMPSRICSNNKVVVQSVLTTGKLSMRRHGDVKAKTENVLNSLSFDRKTKSVHTFDNGTYFFQCAEWFRKGERIALNAIGINEHPSVGWYFFIVLASSPCDVPEKYQGIGF